MTVSLPVVRKCLPAWLKAIARCGLILAGLCAPLGTVELGLRALGPFLPGDYETASFVMPAGELGRMNRPGAAGWRRTNEYTTWVQINSRGLRGPEVPYEKPASTSRILILGDSFVFAQQVDIEETFGRRLAAMLGADPTGAPVEVVSAGVDGWGTANQLAWLETEGYRYSPDVVVLMFFVANDPGDNFDLLGTSELARRRDGMVETDSWQARARELLRHSRVYSVVEQHLAARQAAEERGVQADDAGADPGRRRDAERKRLGWQLSEQLVERLKTFAEQQEMRFLLVGIPSAGRVLGRHEAASSETLGEIAGRLRVDYLDLLPRFQALPRRTRERLYFQQNKHWTRTGHEIVATELERELRSRGLLATRPADRTDSRREAASR